MPTRPSTSRTPGSPAERISRPSSCQTLPSAAAPTTRGSTGAAHVDGIENPTESFPNIAGWLVRPSAPYQNRLSEGPWFESAAFEIDLQPAGFAITVHPILLTGEGLPVHADEVSAQKIWAGLQESSARLGSGDILSSFAKLSVRPAR